MVLTASRASCRRGRPAEKPVLWSGMRGKSQSVGRRCNEKEMQDAGWGWVDALAGCPGKAFMKGQVTLW